MPQIKDHDNPCHSRRGKRRRSPVAALALGASGVQIGTRFLSVMKRNPRSIKKLIDSNEEDTVITKVFSGRPARGY